MAQGLPGWAQHPPDAWVLFRAVAVPAALPVPPASLREEEARGWRCWSLPFPPISPHASDSVARSRCSPSFPQFAHNLLRIGMMSLPSRGCRGCGRGSHDPWLGSRQPR